MLIEAHFSQLKEDINSAVSEVDFEVAKQSCEEFYERFNDFQKFDVLINLLAKKMVQLNLLDNEPKIV